MNGLNPEEITELALSINKEMVTRRNRPFADKE
jgi:hypothetical protein